MPFRWSEEADAELRRLMNYHLGYEEIGARLGCSANAARCHAHKKGWSSHGRSGLIRGERLKGTKRKPETVAKMSALMRRRWKDPEFRSRMVAGIKDAAVQERRNKRISDSYTRRRGFAVPAERMPEFQHLSKKLNCIIAAGKVMGLVGEDFVPPKDYRFVRAPFRDDEMRQRQAKTIARRIAALHDKTLDDLVAPSSKPEVAAARHHAVYELARLKPSMPLLQIGKLFKRDHTTILNSLRRWPQIAAEHGFKVKPLEGRRGAPELDQPGVYLEAAE